MDKLLSIVKGEENLSVRRQRYFPAVKFGGSADQTGVQDIVVR